MRTPWLIALFLLALPLGTHAAGFNCKKAHTKAEKTVCATAALSRLDSDVTAAYSAARKHSKDKRLARDQAAWLKRRDACGPNRECLRKAYRTRLDALGETREKPLAGKAASVPDDGFPWAQPWQRESDNRSVGSQLTLSGTPPKLHFTLSAWNGANTGGLEGQFLLHGDNGTYSGKSGCRIDLHRNGERLVLNEHGGTGSCGAGMGVDYGGTYLQASKAASQPLPDGHSLGVFDSPAQDAAARALLGKDYDTLLDDVNMQGTVDDLDQLGATVGSYFVRGLANSNAAIVMRKGQQLWIGLLVFDSQSKLRMRYYTNVPAWKGRVPRTIEAWHDGNDPSLPIDRMP